MYAARYSGREDHADAERRDRWAWRAGLQEGGPDWSGGPGPGRTIPVRRGGTIVAVISVQPQRRADSSRLELTCPQAQATSRR